MKMLTNRRKGSSYSLKGKLLIAARISHLLRMGLPFTVSWLIIAIIIYSTETVPFGPFTHIGQEVFEIQPSLANDNPAPSIMMILRRVWVPASSYHATPRNIGLAMFSTERMGVRSGSNPCQFQPQAPARMSPASSKIKDRHFKFRTARATTKHPSLLFTAWSRSGWKVPDYFKSSKSLADDIYSGRHGIGAFNNVVFSGGRPASTGAHCDSNDAKFQLN